MKINFEKSNDLLSSLKADNDTIYMKVNCQNHSLHQLISFIARIRNQKFNITFSSWRAAWRLTLRWSFWQHSCWEIFSQSILQGIVIIIIHHYHDNHYDFFPQQKLELQRDGGEIIIIHHRLIIIIIIHNDYVSAKTRTTKRWWRGHCRRTASSQALLWLEFWIF